MTTSRKPLIAGNWKMNRTIPESVELIDAIVAGLPDRIENDVDVLVCPPFTALQSASERLASSIVALGAQNCAWGKDGAYTGEISVSMLLDVGCAFVILGHSERRKFFSETDQTISRRLNAVLATSLSPIVCVGETLNQRESGETMRVLETQVRGCLSGLSKEDMGRITLAYEPVWAIGTGKTATPEIAMKAHEFIRGIVEKLSGNEVAESMRILYGGSVKPGNAGPLFEQPDIDGALVGGASLDASSFLGIISKARSI
ncbi:triose-phosphate isomerase [bacterium]|nr:triose-phosphate isomerase [bacterium]